MAHYISEREMKMLEQDIRENCGEQGFRYSQRETDGVVSERQRRNEQREKRKEQKQTVQRKSESHEPPSIDRESVDLAEEENRRLSRIIQQQEDEIRRMRIENEKEEERILLESQKRHHKEELKKSLQDVTRERKHVRKKIEYDSRSLEETGGYESQNRKLNATYHGPEKETRGQSKYTYRDRDTYRRADGHRPEKEKGQSKYTYHGTGTYHRPDEETELKKGMQSEDDKSLKDIDMKKKVKEFDDIKIKRENVTRSVEDRSREYNQEKFIDKRYTDSKECGSYDTSDDNAESVSSDDYERTDDEDSEEEVRKIQMGIDMLKYKEMALKGQVKEKELEKRQREERQKTALEEEKKRKMLEKKERMRRLQEEQRRLLNSIRENENRL